MSVDALVGVLPVDKPEGPTSHDLVAAARRALGVRRIGHTGTLDPFASGLLLLCIGRATRLAEYLTGLPKTYIATARLGAATETDDRTGAVVGGSDGWRDLAAADIEAALGGLVGRILQVPPAYSAKKSAGERLYRRARRGETVRPAPVPVDVYRVEVLGMDLPDVRFEVECSSGTYIRALARDVGVALEVGAHLVALRRTRIGPHQVAGAVGSDRLDDPAVVQSALLSPLAALAHLAVVQVGDDAAADLGHGAPVTAPSAVDTAGPIAVVHRGALLALASLENGLLRPRKVFADV